MSRGPDASMMLRRALERSADAAAVRLEVGEIESTAWASATFAGARHRTVLAVSGESAGRWLAGLAEADLPMPGQLAADAVVTERRYAPEAIYALVEILTVEER